MHKNYFPQDMQLANIYQVLETRLRQPCSALLGYILWFTIPSYLLGLSHAIYVFCESLPLSPLNLPFLPSVKTLPLRVVSSGHKTGLPVAFTC